MLRFLRTASAVKKQTELTESTEYFWDAQRMLVSKDEINSPFSKAHQQERNGPRRLKLSFLKRNLGN